ncbi:NAD-dependent epimerase/dehydratase family protein [Flavobacterium weaverense]|uniref:Nucleoside-diphosphate-sugar epimerase n=1 Tax=Flavobacterium weaverense TaxID=271156 RepID=A0A3L9ZL50_9FLAO|nr:NAD(P)-dependent oxidoreductase [Flavobacterium weaverense]RMA72970.1 nucleoside-diphosphate-sugar epimerase [Flavobacterium weaverense]
MIKKNILLTGASGTVGFEALKQLLALDRYTITVFDQESEASREKLLPFKDKITIVFGDISNFDDLDAIRNIDFAIHLAAVIPPVADDFPPLAKKVNLNGTQNLVKQLEKHSPTAFMMFSSSISVYGDRIVDPYINVGDQLQPSEGDYYATTKIAAEEYIRNSKLDYTIFRLAAIMGNHKISKLMFHQPLNTALEIATPRDTARAFVNGIEKQHLLSKRIFNLGGGESCRASYKVFLERSFAIFGLGKLNFPEHAFADKNFHCGYYADGDDLEEIVHFRQDTLDDYFKMESEKVSSVRKIATSIIKEPVKWFLLKKSEPYQAFKQQDPIQMKHYFN